VRVNITLHIERIILDGVAVGHAQRPLLQAAVEAELTRLLAEGGLADGLAGGIMVPSLAGSALQLGSAGDPAALGVQIARSVYGGIGAAGGQSTDSARSAGGGER
jgi:hypothetical protein